MRVIVLAVAALLVSLSCAQPGETRVIVTLDVAVAAPADPRDARAEQRYLQAIADAQNRLLQDLRPFDVRVSTRYPNLPLLTLIVDDAALRHLQRSPLVKAVQEDVPGSPPN